MNRLFLLLGLCAAACFEHSQAAFVSIDSDGMLIVNGKRTFIVGLYECPDDDGVLEQVAQAGFKLVHAQPEEAGLDRLQDHGLFTWVNTGDAIDLSADRHRREDQLRALVGQLGRHPALMVWEVPDEALWNCWYGAFAWRHGAERAQQAARIEALQDDGLKERLSAMRADADVRNHRGEFTQWENLINAIWRALGEEPPGVEKQVGAAPERARAMAKGMREGYRLLKRIDPNHPIWMNHAPRNSIKQLAEFNNAADIVGCDIYPVPAYAIGHSDLAERSLAAVGAYTARMQHAAPGKPVWMVLQGFGWGDIVPNGDAETKERLRRPTPDESRFMAFDAIVRGARGILYWGTSSVEKDSPFWRKLLGLVRELSSLEPVLSARDAKRRLRVEVGGTWGSVDNGDVVRVLAKDVDGEPWLLVVNEREEPLEYTIHGLRRLNGVELADPAADRRATVTGGRLRLSIKPFGVQILGPVSSTIRE